MTHSSHPPRWMGALLLAAVLLTTIPAPAGARSLNFFFPIFGGYGKGGSVTVRSTPVTVHKGTGCDFPRSPVISLTPGPGVSKWKADLSGANNIAPNSTGVPAPEATPAKGSIVVIVDEAGKRASWMLTLCDIADGYVASHFHSGSAKADYPPPLIAMEPFVKPPNPFAPPTELPMRCASHIVGCSKHVQGSFTEADIIALPGRDAETPGIANWAQFLDALRAGKIYVNIHSKGMPANLIRGNLVPAGMDGGDAETTDSTSTSNSLAVSAADDMEGDMSSAGVDVVVNADEPSAEGSGDMSTDTTSAGTTGTTAVSSTDTGATTAGTTGTTSDTGAITAGTTGTTSDVAVDTDTSTQAAVTPAASSVSGVAGAAGTTGVDTAGSTGSATTGTGAGATATAPVGAGPGPGTGPQNDESVGVGPGGAGAASIYAAGASSTNAGTSTGGSALDGGSVTAGDTAAISSGSDAAAGAPAAATGTGGSIQGLSASGSAGPTAPGGRSAIAGTSGSATGFTGGVIGAGAPVVSAASAGSGTASTVSGSTGVNLQGNTGVSVVSPSSGAGGELVRGSLGGTTAQPAAGSGARSSAGAIGGSGASAQGGTIDLTAFGNSGSDGGGGGGGGGGAFGK